MIYDAFTVTLLSMLSGESYGSTNALLARYLLEHAHELPDLSIRELAQRAHVGTGTVSRFAREAGFADFGQMREAFVGFTRQYASVPGDDGVARADAVSNHIIEALRQVEGTIDHEALSRLVDDIDSYERVSVFGMLKGQAAALDLQVDLLMQGRYVDSCTSFAEQIDRMVLARRDELIVVFSYTASYFDYRDLTREMRRIDRPKIWMVCGELRELPFFVSDRLSFVSNHDRFGHPYQLEYVANLIAQEYAVRHPNDSR